MASSSLFQLPKARHGEKWIHSPEVQEYAASALEHLFELAAILRHHSKKQSAAFEPNENEGNSFSSQESMALAKTSLNLYKQIDRYVAILHSPVMVEEKNNAEPELDSTTRIALIKLN